MYDAVVVDAPPTGRIGSFLDVTKAMADLAKGGPIRVAERRRGAAAALRRDGGAPGDAARGAAGSGNRRCGRANCSATICGSGTVIVNRAAPEHLPENLVENCRRAGTRRRSDPRRARPRSGSKLSDDDFAGSAHRNHRARCSPAGTAGRAPAQLRRRDGGAHVTCPPCRRCRPRRPVRACPDTHRTGRAMTGTGPRRHSRSMSARILDRSEHARVIVCCGAGGVGKTTTAAALALRAAETGSQRGGPDHRSGAAARAGSGGAETRQHAADR